MAAPKKPNTAAATAAVRRKALERKAAELRAAGYEITPPYSQERTDVHKFRVEATTLGSRGAWIADCNGGKQPLWYTLVGAQLRVDELEKSGVAARLA